MKHFNKKLLAASILLALGAASSAWADQVPSIKDADAKGLGNSAASTGGTSTATTRDVASNNSDSSTNDSNNPNSSTNNSNNPNSSTNDSNNPDSSYSNNTVALGKAKAEDFGAAVNGSGSAQTTKTISKTDNSDGKDGSSSASSDFAASNNGSGSASTTKTITKQHVGGAGEDGYATAEDNAAANNGSGNTATSNNQKTHTSGNGEDAYVKAKDNSAAANNGNATTSNWDSDAEGAGSASTINGNASALYLEQHLTGWGNAAAGSVGGNFTVNNQKLEGEVTGQAAAVPVSGSGSESAPENLAAVLSVVGNKISNSVVGNAGITQVFQNSGTALNQQAVQVSGQVNVGNGSGSVTAP